MPHKPLLTIAIPTWNRATFLAKTLEQLRSEIATTPTGLVEVLVSNNASEDTTEEVIQRMVAAGLPITSIKNPVNMGSDANIAQCFNMASGNYVLILGDDDLLVDHSLATILQRLAQEQYGVVCLRSYGFENDFRQEYPGDYGVGKEYINSTDFLVKVGPLVTFISSCIINRQLIAEVDANQFCGSNLVQVELVLSAMFVARKNFFFNQYIIACLRNNSSGYEFSAIFVKNLFAILDKYQSKGLDRRSIERFENKLLFTFFPFYLTRQRLSDSTDIAVCFENFDKRFHRRFLFSYWTKPIISLPRPLAVVWGVMATVIGRTLNGDLRRGLYFYWNRLIRIKYN